MNCEFHPVLNANNHCHYCDKHFCEHCTDEIQVGRGISVSSACFICGGELDSVSTSRDIEPFWSRLGVIYRYPLATQSIAAILIIALLTSMLGNFGLFALVPMIAINLYSFACLRSTAAGNQETPGVEASFEGSIMPVIYVGISTFLAVFLSGLSFAYFGEGMGILISFFFVLIMPAVIIVIAIEERLMPALNLASLMGILKATGASYFVMVLFVIVMLYSMQILSSMFGNTNFDSLSIFLTSVIGNYYNIVIFHILGYLVYQHHVELGYRTSGNAGVKEKTVRNPNQRSAAQLELLIKAGKFEAARDVVRSNLKPDSSLWEWNRAFKLLCAATPARDVDLYFDRYLHRLQELDETDKIAEAYLLLLRAKPEFNIKDDGTKLDVADALQQNGKSAQSITLVRKLPEESEDREVIGRALELLASGFESLPGSNEHAEHFRTQHALHVAREQY